MCAGKDQQQEIAIESIMNLLRSERNKMTEVLLR